MTTLFRRVSRLIVADADGVGIDLGELAAKFDVQWIQGNFVRCKLTVFNLSRSTLAEIGQQYQRIRIEAGYVQRSGAIFDGQITNVFSSHDGADRVTEIYAHSGARALQNDSVSISLRAGTSLHEAVRAVAASFSDLNLGSLDGLTDVGMVGARTFAQPTRDALDVLAEGYGFEWQVNGTTIEIADKGRATGSGPIEISRATGMVGTPVAGIANLQAVTLLNPAIQAGGLVRIETAGVRAQVSADQGIFKSNTSVLGNGIYQAQQIRHVGETRGQPWYTIVDILPSAVV